MPIVQVSLLKGRSESQLRALAEGITRVVVETTGVKLQAVRVLINEVEPEHWYTAGAPVPPPS